MVTAAQPAKIALDLGCGTSKKPGTVGIDMVPTPAVDIVLDFEHEPLPFEDASVASIFSSHCIEHLREPVPLFTEISRVMVDGGSVEIWIPFVFSDGAFLFDHVGLLSEEQFLHIGWTFPDVWAPRLGARWILETFVYSVPSPVQRELRVRGVDLAFAVRHFHNVVNEIGIRFSVTRRSEQEIPFREPRRLVGETRDQATWRALQATQTRIRTYRLAQKIITELRRRRPPVSP